MNMLTVNYPVKNIGPSAGTKWQSKSIYCLILEILNDQNKLLKIWNICKTGSFGGYCSVEFDNLSGVLEIGGNWRETNYIGGFSNQYPSNGLISVLSFFCYHFWEEKRVSCVILFRILRDANYKWLAFVQSNEEKWHGVRTSKYEDEI